MVNTKSRELEESAQAVQSLSAQLQRADTQLRQARARATLLSSEVEAAKVEAATHARHAEAARAQAAAAEEQASQANAKAAAAVAAAAEAEANASASARARAAATATASATTDAAAAVSVAVQADATPGTPVDHSDKRSRGDNSTCPTDATDVAGAGTDADAANSGDEQVANQHCDGTCAAERARLQALVDEAQAVRAATEVELRRVVDEANMRLQEQASLHEEVQGLKAQLAVGYAASCSFFFVLLLAVVVAAHSGTVGLSLSHLYSRMRVWVCVHVCCIVCAALALSCCRVLSVWLPPHRTPLQKMAAAASALTTCHAVQQQQQQQQQLGSPTPSPSADEQGCVDWRQVWCDALEPVRAAMAQAEAAAGADDDTTIPTITDGNDDQGSFALQLLLCLVGHPHLPCDSIVLPVVW